MTCSEGLQTPLSHCQDPQMAPIHYYRLRLRPGYYFDPVLGSWRVRLGDRTEPELGLSGNIRPDQIHFQYSNVYDCMLNAHIHTYLKTSSSGGMRTWVSLETSLEEKKKRSQMSLLSSLKGHFVDTKICAIEYTERKLQPRERRPSSWAGDYSKWNDDTWPGGTERTGLLCGSPSWCLTASLTWPNSPSSFCGDSLHRQGNWGSGRWLTPSKT